MVEVLEEFSSLEVPTSLFLAKLPLLQSVSSIDRSRVSSQRRLCLRRDTILFRLRENTLAEKFTALLPSSRFELREEVVRSTTASAPRG